MRKIKEKTFARRLIFNFYIQIAVLVSIFNVPLLKAETQSLNEQLVFAVNNEVDSLHPYLTHLILGHFVINFSYHPLVYLDSSGNYQPLIVEKIPNFKDRSLRQVKHNKDYELEADWQLKAPLKWGDGEQITCEDIKFALQVAIDEHISTPTKESFSNIFQIVIDKKNKKKCLVRYKKAKIDFFVDTPSPLPRHVEKSIYEKNKNETLGYEKNSFYNTDATNPGLWNGPYLVTENRLGSHLVLTRNEHFYGEKAKIKKIVIKILKDSGTLEANLNSKSIDMTTRFGLSIDQAQAIETKLSKENVLNKKVIYKESNTLLQLTINLNNEILANVNLRKALELAINKPDLITHLLNNKAKVAEHFKLSLPVEKTPESTETSDRKKKARALLDSIGWKLEKDNLRYKNGKKLSFQITTPSSNKINETIVTFIQDQFKDVGIELKIKTETLKFLFSEKLPKGDFDLAFFSFTFLPEYSWKEVFSSHSIPSSENRWSGYNFSRFNDPEVDKLLIKIESELDKKEREKLLAQLIKIYKAQIPSIPLYFKFDNSVIPINLKNYEINPYAPFESIISNLWEFESR